MRKYCKEPFCPGTPYLYGRCLVHVQARIAYLETSRRERRLKWRKRFEFIRSFFITPPSPLPPPPEFNFNDMSDLPEMYMWMQK